MLVAIKYAILNTLQKIFLTPAQLQILDVLMKCKSINKYYFEKVLCDFHSLALFWGFQNLTKIFLSFSDISQGFQNLSNFVSLNFLTFASVSRS
jgi:hypothetical protein